MDKRIEPDDVRTGQWRPCFSESGIDVYFDHWQVVIARCGVIIHRSNRYGKRDSKRYQDRAKARLLNETHARRALKEIVTRAGGVLIKDASAGWPPADPRNTYFQREDATD